MDRRPWNSFIQKRGSIKMKKLGLVVYFAAGAALVVSGFATAERGLKQNNKVQLEKVAEDYKVLGNMGFEGFNPLDYKIAFSDGENEIVVDYNDGNYETYNREAVYGGLVGSVYQDGDEFQVVVPEYDTWASISAVSGQQLSYVIWHEGFHAYQNTRFKVYENITADILSETELAGIIDSDSGAKTLFEKELKTLSRIITEENSGDIREIAIEYSKIASERRKLLADAAVSSEDFYTMMEGTAYYVEAQAVRSENGDEIYKKNYLETASNYVDGNAKYYRLGMLECMLLDKLDENWKDSYSFDRALYEVIEDYIR
jgi:hypothetical protein